MNCYTQFFFGIAIKSIAYMAIVFCGALFMSRLYRLIWILGTLNLNLFRFVWIIRIRYATDNASPMFYQIVLLTRLYKIFWQYRQSLILIDSRRKKNGWRCTWKYTVHQHMLNPLYNNIYRLSFMKTYDVINGSFVTPAATGPAWHDTVQ